MSLLSTEVWLETARPPGILERSKSAKAGGFTRKSFFLFAVIGN